MMEFGHSEGTFTLKKILVYFVKVPSELRNSQRGARESSFVVWTRLAPGASKVNNRPPKKFFLTCWGFEVKGPNTSSRAFLITDLLLK